MIHRSISLSWRALTTAYPIHLSLRYKYDVGYQYINRGRDNIDLHWHYISVVIETCFFITFANGECLVIIEISSVGLFPCLLVSYISQKKISADFDNIRKRYKEQSLRWKSSETSALTDILEHWGLFIGDKMPKQHRKVTRLRYFARLYRRLNHSNFVGEWAVGEVRMCQWAILLEMHQQILLWIFNSGGVPNHRRGLKVVCHLLSC